MVIALLTIVFIGIMAFNNRLKVNSYQLFTDKVSVPLRLALIADLHSCYYGEGQKELLDSLIDQQPHVVLLGGDIVDDRLPEENALVFVESAAKLFPCYYVTGNHEYRSGRVKIIKQVLKDYGVTVLEGDCHPVDINGQRINICGIDDYQIGDTAYNEQLEKTIANRNPDYYTVLVAHRPEHIDRYLDYNFDLVLTGHSHGGQWRIPGILNGLFAPHQGIFPEYAGGQYSFDNTVLIVSRGLAKESTRVPRIFNPPEIVIIHIIPDEASAQ
jgi:predicted MPP superfamily phosphohydrolase